MATGSGLLTTLQTGTGEGEWIGYQILYGFGMGMCFQSPNLAVQTTLPKTDVPMGIALMFFGQLIGATVFVSAGENVLDNQLLHRLSAVPGFSPSLITSGGVTSLLSSLPGSSHAAALAAYNEALRKVFQMGLIVSCLNVLGAASLEWRSTLEKPGVAADVEANETAEQDGAGRRRE